MRVRTAVEADRERVLNSFAPMFGTWDYLRLVVDWMLLDTHRSFSLVAEDDELVVMLHSYETEPGVWFLRGLRSNPRAGALRIAVGLLGCCRAMYSALRERGARQVRFGTLHYFNGSLRLARILGFREDFRLWHALHRIPDDMDGPGEATDADASDEFLSSLLSSDSVRDGYYFTWWDTRVLDRSVLERASKQNLLLETRRDGERSGAALLHHVPWQRLMALSVLEGDDGSLTELYRTACTRALDLGCSRVGLVHPDRGEVHRRQGMFGFPEKGSYTIQLSRRTGSGC
jgi:hypothetical protein